jgi:type IX secretion system PorP/SprF family membrane protein
MKKTIKNLSFLGIILILSNPILAQQESQFANYIHNPYIFNPAAGGMMDLIQVDLGYRNQYTGTDGNPSTVYLSGHAQIGAKNAGIGEFNLDKENLYQTPERTLGSLKHVVGGKFSRDGIGPFQKTSMYGSYAVHMPLVKTLNIGVGLSAGWSNFQIDQNKVILHDANDNIYNQFSSTLSKQNNLDIQTGLVLYNDKFFFGLSGTQLLNNTVNIEQIETANTLNRHLFLISSYRFGISEKMELEPFAMVKAAQKSPTSFDFGMRMKYNKSIWGGIQYRRGNAFVISAGMNVLKNFNVSYAFEYGAKSTRIGNAGSHELQLGFLIGNNLNVDKEIKESKRNKKQEEKKIEKDPELDIE